MINRNNDAIIEHELDWQGNIEGEYNKIATFRDQAISQMTFRAFAFMKGKSPAVHMAHSVGQFFGMSGLAVDVQGKLIGSLETGEMEDIQSRSSYHHKMHGPGQRSSTSTIPQGLSSTTKTNKIGTNYGQQERRTMT
jgi:hypothetical protein